MMDPARDPVRHCGRGQGETQYRVLWDQVTGLGD